VSPVPSRSPSERGFPDYRPAANITEHPATYELENAAFDSDGNVWTAMLRLAPWPSRTVVDLGCGTGFWLPRYAVDAGAVIGVEPHPGLRRAAETRVAGLSNVEVRAGSAEYLGLPDASVDVIHARFAYFFGEGREPGVAEALRVLRPGGALVVVDNDYRWGEFAELLRAGLVAPGKVEPEAIERFWRRVGAEVVDVRSSWRFESAAQLAAVLRIELPADVADSWLARNPGAVGLSYGYRLWVLRKPIGMVALTSPA
jgi:SAM-dependent methyltransferase